MTLLQSYSGGRGGFTLQQLFWNRSITRVALLPGAAKFDAFRTERVRVGDDGSLTVSGKPLAGPLLVDSYGSTVRLQDAQVLERGPTATLWMPDRARRPRLRLYALGRYADGWLAAAGVIYVWPTVPGRSVSGWLTMRLTASPVVGASKLTFRFGESSRMTVRVSPGHPQSVRIPVCAARNARVTYRTRNYALFGPRTVSVAATPPAFTASRSACESRRPLRLPR